MEIKMQLGKNGLTENFLISLKNAFNNNKNVKISLLKSATRDRDEVSDILKKIGKFLGRKYICKRIGYTIFVKKL